MSNLKKKTQYPYNDQITFELIEEGDVHFRVITNEKGTFIDLRKFFYDKPSQKGVRLSTEVFERIWKAYKNEDKKDEESEKNTPQDIDKKTIFPKKVKK